MDEPGDNNNNSADTSGRSSGGGRSAADPAVRELVDLHAFLLGLVGDGDGAAGDADQNREDAASFSAAAAAAATPAGRGRSIRAMAERNPEMQPLMNVVLETLNSLQTESSCVTYFREVASSVTAYDEEKVTTVSSKEDPLIRAVMESGAVRDLVRSMGRDDEDDDYEATYALIHYVDAGTEWNIQHAVDEGVLPKFVALLKSPSVGIRKEAARVLGNMTNVSQGARRSWREPLWDCGAIDAMVTLLQQDDDDDVLQYAAEAVGNVCEDQPNEERIRSVAPTLSQLLFYHDEKVLEKVCWALNSCLVYTEALQSRVQTIIRMGVCRRLVELLRDPSPEVQ